MSPTLPEVLHGLVAALSAPLPEEAGGDYRAARASTAALLAHLAGQEAERGIAARVFENAAMQALFAAATQAYDAHLGARLAQAGGLAAEPTLSALDALNAALRRLLIALHEEVERRGDRRLDAAILDLYQRMAKARALELPIPFGE